ncbi:hypothetical protein KGM_202582 [Danaus plexippus plexippus]|uniref:Uncharacterized protein n=1 Tax=Danaus plexippus plexippus TaxID=278856 RepID=A0A212EZ50_DANPL|nr:hypothetical protein KGM_202582 [Danaus plexippus plexippus]
MEAYIAVVLIAATLATPNEKQNVPANETGIVFRGDDVRNDTGIHIDVNATGKLNDIPDHGFGTAFSGDGCPTGKVKVHGVCATVD